VAAPCTQRALRAPASECPARARPSRFCQPAASWPAIGHPPEARRLHSAQILRQNEGERFWGKPCIGLKSWRLPRSLWRSLAADRGRRAKKAIPDNPGLPAPRVTPGRRALREPLQPDPCGSCGRAATARTARRNAATTRCCSSLIAALQGMLPFFQRNARPPARPAMPQTARSSPPARGRCPRPAEQARLIAAASPDRPSAA
jgi:hypothetical protein